MATSTLTYIAQPGQIKLGTLDPLTNLESVPVKIEGYAIKGHIDDYGHSIVAGFDIVSIKLARPALFASAHAIVMAETGTQFEWKQIPQAAQWADEQVSR